jgi:hypothetical protein
MTPKEKARAKRPPARKAPAKTAKSDDKQLGSDRRLLQQRLAEAERRIEMLERQREEALNRLDWVIDSIRTLVEDVRKSGG